MKNYTQSPYSNISFSDMTTDKLELACTHFICLLGIALSKKYNVDTESLVQNNFSKLDISSMGIDMLNNFIKDCEGYIGHIKTVEQIKNANDINIAERSNALSNTIDNVLPVSIQEAEFLTKVKDLKNRDSFYCGTGSLNFEDVEHRDNQKQSVEVVEDEIEDFELIDDEEDVFTFDDNLSNENDNTDDELRVSEDGTVYM